MIPRWAWVVVGVAGGAIGLFIALYPDMVVEALAALLLGVVGAGAGAVASRIPDPQPPAYRRRADDVARWADPTEPREPGEPDTLSRVGDDALDRLRSRR